MPVQADPAAHETILRNLFADAAKYAVGSARAKVHVESTDREARLAVRDFGPGVSGNLAKLLDPFVRGDGPLVASQPGVGLGLCLWAGLAVAGRAEARNAPEDRGFEVELSLPLGAGV